MHYKRKYVKETESKNTALNRSFQNTRKAWEDNNRALRGTKINKHLNSREFKEGTKEKKQKKMSTTGENTIKSNEIQEPRQSEGNQLEKHTGHMAKPITFRSLRLHTFLRENKTFWTRAVIISHNSPAPYCLTSGSLYFSVISSV